MKKTISLVLAFVLIFTLTAQVFAQSITLTPDKESVKAGEDVTVTVSFNEALEHVTGLPLELHFNGSLFTFKSGKTFDSNATILASVKGTSPDLYKRVNWITMQGDGTINAGDFIACTFTAKEDIRDLTTAEFAAKVVSDELTMMPGYDAPTYPDSKISVTVTPAASTYSVETAAVNPAITVNEDAQVSFKVSHDSETTYNAYYLEASYDSSILTYKSVTPATATVTDDGNGTLKIAGYGENKTCGTDNIVLTFTGKTVGAAKVTLTSAKIDAKANAAEKDAPAANIKTAEATVTVGGYQVTLPDDFTGAGTANPGEDYTFEAKDPNVKYDFSGSTMGGENAEVIDAGNGKYIVKNVTGPLDIKAVALVKINLSGDAVDTITQKSWGEATEVNKGTELWFMAAPNGKELVVTVNGEEITGVNMQAFLRYTIAAEKVTGAELNIAVNYKPSAETITIIETGDAWDDVTQRGTWPAGGGQITPAAGDTYLLKIKLAAGKTVDDYVVTINGKKMTLKRQGPTYSVSFNPTEVAVDGKITIDVSYVKPSYTVNVTEYVKLNNQSIFLVTATGDVADGKVLAYGESQMYWSSKYNDDQGAYTWLVISDKKLDEVKTEAEAAITAVSGDKVEILYNGDVNLTEVVDINDAQLVWNMYNAEYSNFDLVNVRKFLEADMTADGALNTDDAAAIVALIMK